MFWWLGKTTSLMTAAILSLVFTVHPATIYYITLLDATFLSTVMIFWMYYLLWNVYRDQNTSIVPLALAVLLLFFTRSMFQWPTIIVFIASLLLLQIPAKKILLFVVITAGVSGLYITKQYSMFETTSTFSWRGLNICRSIGENDRYSIKNYRKFLDTINITETNSSQNSSIPSVLTRKQKLHNATNLNNLHYLPLNDEIVSYCTEKFMTTSISRHIESYLENLQIYFSPSSQYKSHRIVDQLSWRKFYDRVFSTPILPALLLLSLIFWSSGIRSRQDIIKGFGFILPALFIFAMSTLGEKGENDRLKYFLEPLMFVFIFVQLYRKLITFATFRKSKKH